MPIIYPDPKKKKLKLAFAMGGGVSLGAFSGSALTEVIKISLLKIADGTADYGSVVIDVFSGASAGSMSIAVMLRALSFRMGAEVEDAERRLKQMHPGLKEKWDSLPSDLQQDLIAAQVAQDLQARAWVAGENKGINLDSLLAVGRKDRAEALKSAAGLLDSEAVYEIARSLLVPDKATVEMDRRLLGQRCVFAPTLTNLTPLVADSRDQFSLADGAAHGLRDALRSLMHKDMRVFDIHFIDESDGLSDDATDEEKAAANTLSAEKINHYKEIEAANKQAVEAAIKLSNEAAEADAKQNKEMASSLRAQASEQFSKIKPVKLPSRWFRMHEGTNHFAGSWALGDAESWTVIAATALASGAFPGAFQPAVITRYRFEYDEHMWPKGLPNSGSVKDQHPFAYCDGGVFNNDPIRETLRLCSFMDAKEEAGTFERFVVYVDPSVGPEGVTFGVPALMEMKGSKGSLWNFGSPEASSLRPTLPRLLSLFGGVLGMLIHQGRSRDVDGLAQTRNYLVARSEFRAKLRKMTPLIGPELAVELWSDLRDACTELCLDLFREMIPPGEGTLPGELRRVAFEEAATLSGMGIEVAEIARNAELYFTQGPLADGLSKQASTWIWLLLCVYFDLLLGLEGKTKTTILAITPYENDSTNPAEPKAVKLLGDVLAAFGGFMWDKAQRYDYDMGRYCAGFFSSKAALLAPAPQWQAARPKVPSRADYAKALHEGMEKVRGRIEEAVGSAFGFMAKQALGLLDLKGALDDAVDPLVAERYSAKAIVDEGKPVEMEFMILLADGQDLVLDASSSTGDHDSTPLTRVIAGKANRVLLTSASFFNGEWTGGAVHQGTSFLLQVPRTIWDRDWAVVELPGAELLAELQKKAEVLLRPVTVIDLGKVQPAGDTPTISQKHWDAWEGAAPLAHILQFGGSRK